MKNVSNKPNKVTIDDLGAELITQEVIDVIDQIEWSAKIEYKKQRISFSVSGVGPVMKIFIAVVTIAAFFGYHSDKIPIFR